MKKSDWIYYKELKKECQRESRKAYSSHVNSLVSAYQIGNPKKLYSFISGVAPHSSNRTNHSDSVKKSNILNDPFTSVFTLGDTTSKLTPSDHPDAKPIVVNRKGVLKLLKDINLSRKYSKKKMDTKLPSKGLYHSPHFVASYWNILYTAM